MTKEIQDLPDEASIKKGGRGGLTRRLRSPDLVVVALGVVALLLVGPLRGMFEVAPLVGFLSTVVLFMVPGVLISYRYLSEQVWGITLVPVAFAISAGLFGFMGVPMLMLNTTTETFLIFTGATVAVFLIAGAFGVFRQEPAVREKSGSPAETLAARILWGPFALLGAGLAYVSWTYVPNRFDDLWVYLSYVRGFLDSDALARYEPYFNQENGLSRVKINGWLLEQAALARVSGIDPNEMVIRFLNPALVLIGLLAFYALARALFKSEAAALLAGCLYALYFSIHLSSSILPPGSEFVARMVEDKYLARFVFLPVALSVAVYFLESRQLRYLFIFAFLCWTSVTVHPAGLAIIALSTAGLCIIYLAVNWRERDAWVKTAGLGVAGASVALMPVIIRVATGVPFAALLKSADINDGIPAVLANMVFVKPIRKRIYEIEPGLYIMHPSLLLDPVIMAALLIGIPFLLWRLKGSLAAQILLGILVFTTIVTYVPQIATFMGDNIVVPGQLHRLAWPIPLAALLIVSWMAWEVIGYLISRIGGTGMPRVVAAILPAVLVAGLAAAALPSATAGAKEISRVNRAPSGTPHGFDPIFPWLRDNIEEPGVIMAPDEENTIIPAWSEELTVVSRRGELVLMVLPQLEERAGHEIKVPRGSWDVKKFYSGASLEEGVRLLRKYEADYVMAYADSPLDKRLSELPGFTPMDSPKQMYSLYSVDLDRISRLTP